MILLFLLLILAAQGVCLPGERTLWQPYWISPRTGSRHVAVELDWQVGWQDSQISQVRDLDPERWLSARVPGSVHWALHRAGRLPHPYYNLNADQYAWVDSKVWYYQTTFQAAPREGWAFLCFDGIDYFSRVWLNGVELGRHEGMFGGPIVEVGQLLRRGEPNSLVVEVRAANWGKRRNWNYWKLGSVIKPWLLAGGLGAEKFFPLGIWRPVRLEFVPAVHLERPRLVTQRASVDSALLALQVEVLAGTHSLEARLHPASNAILSSFRNPLESPAIEAAYSLIFEMTPRGGHKPSVRQVTPLRLRRGRNWVEKTVDLPNPRLWWPNGMGAPDLYRVRVALARDAEIVDSLEFDFGIRTFKATPTAGPRTQDRWAAWQFSVNGRKFLVKGMNWMPADVLLDLPVERYRWLLETARDAGIQLIRVWGGGLIETDEFYRIADELGLLVWQEFPIGNQDTPLWPQDVWEAQVVQNIIRLRNHPSLAIWCGGNEFNPYSPGNAASVGIVERSVRDFDGSRPFFRTSPDAGSVHLYPDMDPTWFGRLYSEVPFVAETGIQIIPEAAGMREVINSAELNGPMTGFYDSTFKAGHPELVHHFVALEWERLPRMLSRASQVDDISAPTLESLAEASQVGAGEFYQVLSEAMQANYPVTAGLLPWVLKRPWPVAGIMMLDGFGQPAATYYFLKRTYQPVHVAMALPHLLWAGREKMPVAVHVINAEPEPVNLLLSAEILDPQMKSRYRRSREIAVQPGPSVSRVDLDAFTIPADFEEKFFFALVELKDGEGRLVSRSVYWPRCLRRMSEAAFRDSYRATPHPTPIFEHGPWLKPQVRDLQTRLVSRIVDNKRGADGRNRLRIHVRNIGATAAFMTQVDVEGRKRVFRATDNFFWLEPGEERDLELQILWREPGVNETVCSVRAWNAAPQRLMLVD